jgi:hypothetical protein
MHDPPRRQILRWYRCTQTIWLSAGLPGGLAVIAGGAALALNLSDPRQRGWWWLGALFVLAGAYLLISGFRAGIGVARDGVLIRSMTGRTRWISWPQIDRFTIIRRRGARGGQVAVIAVTFTENRKPLLVDSCAFRPWGKDWTKTNRKIGALQDGLETARAGIPNP